MGTRSLLSTQTVPFAIVDCRPLFTLSINNFHQKAGRFHQRICLHDVEAFGVSPQWIVSLSPVMYIERLDLVGPVVTTGATIQIPGVIVVLGGHIACESISPERGTVEHLSVIHALVAGQVQAKIVAADEPRV